VREQRYEHNVDGEGFDHCYDCHAEIEVLTNYLKKAGKECTPRTVRFAWLFNLAVRGYCADVRCLRSRKLP
jgi:hypothetical protein